MVANGKYFAKDSLKWLPAFGWGMWMLGFIFIKRSWTDDKDTIEQTFSRIRDLKIPVWLVSFLEGTRIRPHKLVEVGYFARRSPVSSY
jgi:lysophosphatidic acid acyltransferase/lysophosphatidylinositol acyltransferase